MSRQQGRRRPPRRIQQTRSKRGQRAARETAAPARTPIPYDERRFWIGAGVGTVLALVATWTFVLGAVALDEDAQGSSLPLFLALGVVPLSFLAMAKVSKRPDAMSAAAWATVVGLGAGVAVIFLARDIVSGFVAMFGAGGVAALPRPQGTGIRERVAAVVIATAYASVMVRVAPAVGLITGPALALPVLAAGDRMAIRRLAVHG
ncbi:MAG: hypothetical protein ACE5E8_09950 [Acidimicrobiia bacterium]